MLNPYLEKKSPSAFLFPSEFFKKVGEGKNEQTKVYDHGGQATRGQKMSYNSLLWLSSLHLVHILLLSLKLLTLVHIIKYD